MKSIIRVIKKAEKIVNIAEKNEVYTITFYNPCSLFNERSKIALQEMQHVEDIDEHPVWGIIKQIINSEGSFTYTSGVTRNACTISILQQAGFYTFTYMHCNTKLFEHVDSFDVSNVGIAVVTTDASINRFKELIEQINVVYEKYFVDYITLEQDTHALEQFRTRIEYTKKEMAEQAEWLSTFKDTMLDEISKESFVHFLRERIQHQLFYSVDNMYFVGAPPCTNEWRMSRLKEYLTFPEIYDVDEVERRFLAGDAEVKLKHNLPTFAKLGEQAIRFAQFHNLILEQYAISGKSLLKDGDTVIDAGGWIGDTAIYFSKKVGETGQVYSFEPIKPISELAILNCKNNNANNVCVVQSALSDRVKELKFESLTDWVMDAHPSDTGTYLAETIALDQFVEKEKCSVDFIKMDIEGSEMATLEGAKKTIRHFKPDCAIVVHHKKNDYWDIPHFLLELCPEYRFYFRCDAEPMLFATVRHVK